VISPQAVSIPIAVGSPLLALAPMQDITDLPFMRMLMRYGGPDLFFTEFFRVTKDSVPAKAILRSVTENDTGRPVIAQLIGNDIDALVRTADRLFRHPIAGIDLNLGCPAPVVYRKCAGGGLLRDPERISLIIAAMRDAIPARFTVKTRVGFSSDAEFPRLLEIFARHRPDMVTVHARTVQGRYGPVVYEERITQAVNTLPCPVLANGTASDFARGLATWRNTGSAGIMIGRGAIRNPWIFDQIRDAVAGRPVRVITGRDVMAYIHDLYESVRPPGISDAPHVQKMKKYLNFLGEGLSETFLHDMRRAQTPEDLFCLCDRELNHDQPVLCAHL